MVKEKVKILVKRRLAELECLNISPALYYNISKYLERRVCTVQKDGKLYIFKSKDSDLQDIKNPNSPISVDFLAGLVAKIYGIDINKLLPIIYEWVRERKIYQNMTLNSSKYWDYIALPNTLEEMEDAEYGF